MNEFFESPAAFGALAIVGMGALLWGWSIIKKMILGDLPEEVKTLREKVAAVAKEANDKTAEAVKELRDLILKGQQADADDHTAMREALAQGFKEAREFESEKRKDLHGKIDSLTNRVSALEGKGK